MVFFQRGWSLLAMAASLHLVTAWQPDFILRMSQQTIHSDCQPRESIVVNGTSPGPLLRMKEGEHYWIRVYNDIPDQNTTIHWHGFSQYLSPFSDGTPQASGWPIPPGHFYDYEFQLEAGFYGTYWYHSHVNLQVMTAQGPIIVDPAYGDPCPVEYDEELVMMMSDYYHEGDQPIIDGLTNNTLFQWLNEPQNLLVNGNALGKCNATALKPNQTCTDQCGNNQQFVKPGTKYRVRVIGATILSYIGMALEDHEMTLFEADGTYIEPMKIDSLQIAAGQRYSVLIETKQNPNKTDYYWRTRTMWRPTRVNGSALWSYDDNATSDPYYHNYSTAATPVTLNQTVPLPSEEWDWVSGDIVAANRSDYPPADSEVTRQIILNGLQLVTGPQGKGFRWFVNTALNNGSTPDVPFLVQYYTTPEDQRHPNYSLALANGGYDPSTNSYPVKLGEVLDIVLQNRAGQTSGMAEAHPWHSHGAKYWDMGAGLGNFSYAALNANLAARSGKPFPRDTSVVYPGPGDSYNASVTDKEGPAGWRVFRIRVTDPGLWLVHCHLAPHQVMGMMTSFLYGGENLPPIPQTLLNEYATFGGGAYGQQVYDYYGPGQNTSEYIPRSYFDTMAQEKRDSERGVIEVA